MSAKATPINQLNSQFPQNNDNIVNDILKEIDQTNPNNQEETKDDMIARQASFQMDPSIQPGQQYQGEPDQMPPQQMMQPDQQMQYVDQGQMDPSMLQNGYQMDMPVQQKTFTEKILDEMKNPLIVSVLFVLFSLKQLDTSVIKFIPKALSATGEITPIGLATKGLIVGVVFYLLKKFV